MHVHLQAAVGHIQADHLCGLPKSTWYGACPADEAVDHEEIEEGAFMPRNQPSACNFSGLPKATDQMPHCR